MLASFLNLNFILNKSFQFRLHKYGFMVYLTKKLATREVNNINAIINFLGGTSFFFNSKTILANRKYINCFVVTFPSLDYSINFPYYLDTIFSNFNYFPTYFKFNKNLIPLGDNFIFSSIFSLINIDKSKTDLSFELFLQKRRLFILFKFFFNFFVVLSRVKTCQR